MVNVLENNRAGEKEREVWDEGKNVTNFYMVAREAVSNRLAFDQRTKSKGGRSPVGRCGGQGNSKC